MKYRSCRLLEHGIYIYLDPGTQQLCAGHCCNTDHLEFDERLYLYPDLKKENLNWDYVFSEKRKLRENAKKGTYPSQCEGCFELQEREWDDNDYINHLTAAHIMKCNSRCIYCPTGRIPEWHNREQEVDLKPLIEELINKNLLKFNGSLRFVGGEPTLMKEFDWLVDLFSAHNVPEIYVPTSGIKLSKSLCTALEKIESAAIVASIDSGTKQTFEKIKGTKFFEVVMKNMKTYLYHSRLKNFVILKYILLTGYNDSSKEIDMWLKNCADMGIVEVQFDAEHSVSSSENCENKKYVNRTLKMLKYAEIAAKKYNIKVTSFLAFMNRANRIYENQLNYFNANKDKFIDLILPDLDFSKYYKNINMNIDKDFKFLNDIEKLVISEHFSPNRKAILTSDYKEITKSPNFEQIAKTLLRLGFDLEFKTFITKKIPILEEILKTSFSIIHFESNKILLGLIKKQIVNSIYKNSEILGKIDFI